jgi:EmrB/QacA subfamily drug resistance transporter
MSATTRVDTEPHRPPELSPRRRRGILVVVCLALMMVVSAVSGLNVALPDLAVDTGASQTELTWIVDAYTLAFVGLLLPLGAVGDRFGRRGVLVFGLLAFGLGAALAMTTGEPSTLITLRALMGVGAAAVMPATLSVITSSFPPEERARAVGVWVGVAGGGAVLGLLASGILLELFSWSSFFGLNVTLALLALAGTLALVPSSRDDSAPRLDPVGAVLSLAGIVGVVLAIIEGPERGWTGALTVTGLAVGVLGLVAFVAWELRRPDPMLDPRLFRLRGFSAGSLAITVQFFGSFGFFFVVMQYLQYVQGRSPLMAAVCLLPLPVVLIPLARRAPLLAARLGTHRVVSLGLALSATGMLLLSRLALDTPYWFLALGIVVFAAGMGLAGTPATTAIVASLPRSQQGVASAVNDASRELGSVLGIAILGSVLNAAYRDGLAPATDGLPPQAAEAARSSIAFIERGADRLAAMGPAGDRLASAAQQSFVDATGTAFLVAAGVLLVGAVAVWFRAPREMDEPPASRVAGGS